MVHETIAEFLGGLLWERVPGAEHAVVNLRSFPESEVVAERPSDVGSNDQELGERLVKHSRAVVAVEACPTVRVVDESISIRTE
jgi:hypothetical protein